MPNLGSVLKQEIARIARRELRAQIGTTKRLSAQQRRHIAALRRQLALLERRVASLNGKVAENSRPADPEDESAQVRFVAKGLRSLRGRLGLSAESFGRLIGVSGQSIYNWERQVTTPRAEQRKMLAQVRGIGKRQALARLQSMAAAASATKPAARVQRQSARRPAG